MRHVCCKGVEGNCRETCQAANGRAILGRDIPLIDCHHQDYICRYQIRWFGHTKYCDCIKHGLLQRRKEEG